MINISTIKKIDKSHMHKVYEKWPQIAEESYKKDYELVNFKNINHIIFAGMGGSGTIGDIFSAILSKTKMHVSVTKGYLLPKTIDSKTLIVITSVSGNTIETLSVLKSVKKYQKLTMPPQLIAKSLKLSLEQVCEILGYPSDEKSIMNYHKDFCFYDHGVGNHIDYRLDSYGFFLEENDFETWQPVCYMDKSSNDFFNLKKRSEEIPSSNNPVIETRRLWIKLRFCVYQSSEYRSLLELFLINFCKIPGAQEWRNNFLKQWDVDESLTKFSII